MGRDKQQTPAESSSSPAFEPVPETTVPVPKAVPRATGKRKAHPSAKLLENGEVELELDGRSQAKQKRTRAAKQTKQRKAEATARVLQRYETSSSK